MSPSLYYKYALTRQHTILLKNQTCLLHRLLPTQAPWTHFHLPRVLLLLLWSLSSTLVLLLALLALLTVLTVLLPPPQAAELLHLLPCQGRHSMLQCQARGTLQACQTRAPVSHAAPP